MSTYADLEIQQQVDNEWHEARTSSLKCYSRCPQCKHYIDRHTAITGEGMRICAACLANGVAQPCDRYVHDV